MPDYEEGESEDEGGIDYIYELDFVEILKDAPLALAIFSDSSELGMPSRCGVWSMMKKVIW